MVIAFLAPVRLAAYTPLAYVKGTVGQDHVGYLYWQQIRSGESIPFGISRAGTPDIEISSSDSAIDEFEALSLAFRTWERVPDVPVRFSLTPTDTHTWGYDGENVVFFADLGDVGYGAVTLITNDNTTGQLLDVDIHMNDHNIRWLTSGNDPQGEPAPCPCQGVDPNGVYANDVQGIATHEIGHALGLDHSAIGMRESARTPTMYPLGIWNVPGDEMRPPDSRYRTLEPDDVAGLQALYPPAAGPLATGALTGVVHDGFDRPVFGASVVARNVQSGVEIGVLTGTQAGTFVPDRFVLTGLPPGSYEVRVEPLVGSAPGYVGPWNFGGIENALVTMKSSPDAIALPVTYEHLVFTPAEATAVSLAAGESREITFRPIGTIDPVPTLLRPPRAFDFRGTINVDVSGPLRSASFVSTYGQTEHRAALPIVGGAYSVHVPQLPSGTVVDSFLEVETTAGDLYRTLPSRMQVGLSGEPLIFVSETGSGRLSVVDSGTFFEVDVSSRDFSYPLGQTLHHERNGVYVTNFGTDHVSFVPLFAEHLPHASILPFDADGDGLTDALERIFHTDPANPDTDGDLVMDGVELSEFGYVHPDAGASFFEVIGGTVASDSTTSIGGPDVELALWNLTDRKWQITATTPTPTGRFHLRLPTGKTFRLSYFDGRTGQFLASTANWSGLAQQVLDGGVTRLGLSAPNRATPDTGSDPLDALDGAAGVFLPTGSVIPLEEGANPYGAALASLEQRYLFVSGNGTDKVYKIDTRADTLVGEAAVGRFPRGLAVTPDGSKVYVANSGEFTVSVLDARTMQTLATIPMPGRPESVSLTPDGAQAVVTCSGTSDVVLIDTTHDLVLESLSSGVGDLSFLSSVSLCDRHVLAGSFRIGESRLVRLDTGTKALEVIPLGPSIGATSGVALHPDGRRGYAIDYMKSELVEFDLPTGATLRRAALGVTDIRDVMLVPAAGSNGGWDRCDRHDGPSTVGFVDSIHLSWQAEPGADGWNVYRGDVDVLRSSRVYSQASGTNPLALRVCGLSQPSFVDTQSPPAGHAAFYMITATAAGVEGDLGTDSAGLPRANDHPCQ